MKSQVKSAKDTPLRIKILERAFGEGWNLEQVNSELEKHFCERLYARNRYEAGLIYAFQNGLTYEEWKELYQKYIDQERKQENGKVRIQESQACRQQINDQRILEGEKRRTTSYASGIWRGRDITFKTIKDYVRKNSQNEVLETGMWTFLVEEELKKVEVTEDNAGFGNFMEKNEAEFSAVREKARYYFCKYLSFYIEERCQKYYEKCEKKREAARGKKEKQELEKCRREEQLALAELDILKKLTKLKEDSQNLRSELTHIDRIKYLEQSRLSCRKLFDNFNYFYFGFITLERAEYLYESYGELFKKLETNKEEQNFQVWEKWEEEILRVAQLLGIYKGNLTPRKKEKVFSRLLEIKECLELKEEQLDAEYHLKPKNRQSQKGRSGETYFRDFITGKRDVNRDTLITFLLFVDGTTKLAPEQRITLLRLNRILVNCGFAQLVPEERTFDDFISAYLRKNNRQEEVDLLYEAVQEAVERGEDFCLWKIYLYGKSQQKELLKYLFKRG